MLKNRTTENNPKSGDGKPKNRLRNCTEKGRRRKDGGQGSGDEGDIDDQSKRLVRELREQERAKNKDLSIGTWNNEMLKENCGGGSKTAPLGDDDEDEDESALLEGQLPQNLFIMDPTDLSTASKKGGKDWLSLIHI